MTICKWLAGTWSRSRRLGGLTIQVVILNRMQISKQQSWQLECLESSLADRGSMQAPLWDPSNASWEITSECCDFSGGGGWHCFGNTDRQVLSYPASRHTCKCVFMLLRAWEQRWQRDSKTADAWIRSGQRLRQDCCQHCDVYESFSSALWWFFFNVCEEVGEQQWIPCNTHNPENPS